MILQPFQNPPAEACLRPCIAIRTQRIFTRSCCNVDGTFLLPQCSWTRNQLPIYSWLSRSVSSHPMQKAMLFLVKPWTIRLAIRCVCQVCSPRSNQFLLFENHKCTPSILFLQKQLSISRPFLNMHTNLNIYFRGRSIFLEFQADMMVKTPVKTCI